MASPSLSFRKVVLRAYFPLLVLFSLFAGIRQQPYPDLIFTSDPEGYYMYIAAPFFSGGFDNYKPRTPVFTPYPGTNKIFTKYTYGTALFEAPFAFIAHIIYILKVNSHDSHGRFPIYGMGVLFGFIFYSMLALWMLRRFLEKRFDPVWVMVALCGLYLGTNWMYYTVKEPGTSHVVSLFILTCWLLFVPKIFRAPTTKNFVIGGLIFGLISLVRPTNAVAIFYLFFAAYAGPNGGTWRDRWNFLQKNWKNVWLAVLTVLLVWCPQMWYWHSVTGHWILYSYDEEGFTYWNSPKILSVLFDVQNGLFVYAPILFMPLIGLLHGMWHRQAEAYGIAFLLTVLTYLFASWHVWYFGGAFGHRCYVDWMGFLSLPFCWFLQKMVAPRHSARWAVAMLVPCLIYLSIGLGYLYQYPWEHPNWTWQKLLDTIGKLLPC